MFERQKTGTDGKPERGRRRWMEGEPGEEGVEGGKLVDRESPFLLSVLLWMLSE